MDLAICLKSFKKMDSLLKGIPFTNCYIDDILVASEGTLDVQKATVQRTLEILNKSNMAVKWGKCALFGKEMERLGFKISEVGVMPLVEKADAINCVPIPKNLSEL